MSAPTADARPSSRKPKRKHDIYRFERELTKRGFMAVAGVDEAGRGACAGPLVVGAAILDLSRANRIRGINDSKLLTPHARDDVYEEVVAKARAWSVVVIPADEVDAIGLHVANLQGMRRALARLEISPDYAVSDGYPLKGLGIPTIGVWKGDRVCASASAAGVLAKVTRDRIMVEYARTWPEYGFEEHKGYVTSSHRNALAAHGPSPIHRTCFAPVREAGREDYGQSSPLAAESAILDLRQQAAGKGNT